MKVVGVMFIALCGIFFAAWLMFVHHTEAYQLGVRWNVVSGELSMDESAGYHITPPWVFVSRIDTRPMRVCITSASRAFNCRLVQFVPSEYKSFVKVQGFSYWWWANRISFNLGYSEEYRGMRDLLRGYAYGVKKYPFVVTLTEYGEDE